MRGTTTLRVHARQAVTVLCATALAFAGTLVAATPASAAPGDVTTVAGGGQAPVGAVTQNLGNTNGLEREGNTLYVAMWEGYIVARNLDTGAQTLYAGSTTERGHVDGSATVARFENLSTMALDHEGNLYVNENDWDHNGSMYHCGIRRIDKTTHEVTTYAGEDAGMTNATGTCNSVTGDGGDANNAGFYAIWAMAFDSHDNLFISGGHGNIRRIDHETHVIDTYTGSIWNGAAVDTANTDPQLTLLDARYKAIAGLAFDADDNLYIDDSGNNVIRKIDTAAATPTVTTVVGHLVNDYPVRGFVDGPVATAQFDLNGSVPMFMSPAGDLYLDDHSNHRIRKITHVGTPDAMVTTVAGNGTWARSGDGGPAVLAAIDFPKAMVLDAQGGLYMSEGGQNQLRFVGLDGVISNRMQAPQQAETPDWVGDGGPATEAVLGQPIDLLRIGTDLYVADQAGNRIRRIDLDTGVISTFAGNGHQGATGNGGPATAARLDTPRSIAATEDHSKMYIATGDGHIRMVNLNTNVITTVAGTGTECAPTSPCGDGGPATSAQISPIVLLTVAPDGDVIIGDAYLNKVRRIDAATGIISTIAGTGVQGYSPDSTTATSARLTTPGRVIVSPAGTVVFGEVSTGLVREIKANGKMDTIAGRRNANGTPDLSGSGDGGQARSASIAGAVALRYDAAGNLYIGQAGGNPITDAGNNSLVNPAIRMVDAQNHKISTFAGTTYGFSGDGGPATAAQFGMPAAIAPDAGTDMYVADLLNGRIRKVEGVPGDLVTQVKAGVLKAGSTGRVTIKENNAGAGWVTGPIKATVTLPAGLTYKARGGTTGWTCNAKGQTVKCVTRASMAPHGAATVNLTVNVAPRAKATVALKANSTSDSARAVRAHQVSALSVAVLRATR